MTHSKKQFNWCQFDTAEQVSGEIYSQIEILSSTAIKNKNCFKIVLAGGTTPQKIYKKLVKLETDWSKWQVFFGDERCLDKEDPERNSKMVYDNWLSQVAISEENIHFIDAELGAAKASRDYQKILQPLLPFDLVLNGMGEDGHTASLFPDKVSLDKEPNDKDPHQQALCQAVFNSPKPPSDRVSLSFKALSSTYRSFIIITGKSKYQSVKRWQNGVQLPVNQLSCLADEITGDNTLVDIFIDQQALNGIS